MTNIHLHIDDAVASLTLDNPSKLNTLTWDMLLQLEQHIAMIEANNAIRVVVIKASPSKAFCAGAAINEWGALSPQEFSKAWLREGHRIFDRLARLSVPTIGLIESPVMGGGLELIATLDWRIFSNNVTLSLPEPAIGVIPGWSGTQRLYRLLPEPILRGMILFGNVITAQEAKEFGFAEIADDPQARCDILLENCLSRSSQAHFIAKMMVNAAADEDRAAMIESLAGGFVASSDDKKIGVEAFTNKQKPNFNQKRKSS